MLDVHPPHEAVHTWKDFSIHVATICVGLLIAIGLEQTVEAIHHRIEVAETRKKLEAEFEDNLLSYRLNLACTRFVRQEMNDNLAILLYLKQHPGTPEEQLPGTLHWRENNGFVVDSAWTVAQQNGVTALMPRGEVANLNASYSQMKDAAVMETRLWDAVNLAIRFSYGDPDPSHLSPAQLDKQIDLTEACIEANFRWSLALRDFADADERFTPHLTKADLENRYGRTRTPAELQKLTAARKLINDREKQYIDAIDAAGTAIEAHDKQSNE
jgi:hypothetical protein